VLSLPIIQPAVALVIATRTITGAGLSTTVQLRPRSALTSTADRAAVEHRVGVVTRSAATPDVVVSSTDIGTGAADGVGDTEPEGAEVATCATVPTGPASTDVRSRCRTDTTAASTRSTPRTAASTALEIHKLPL
jgi:hypothetical protein